MPLALTPSLRVARIILPLAAVMAVHAPSASAALGSLALQGCSSTSATESCALGFGLTGAHGVAVSPDGASVYVASKTNGGLASFERDPATGATSELGCFSQGSVGGCTTDGTGALLGAAGVAVSPDGSNVYVAADSSNAVITYARSPSGTLTKTGCISEGVVSGCTTGHGLSGATGIKVSPDGADVYVASESSNAVAVFSRGAGGALTQLGCLAQLAADTCTPASGLSHATGVALSPDGANVYVTALASNAVVAFRRDAAGALTKTGCVAESAAEGCAAGHGLTGANGITVAPDGGTLYVASETGSALATLARAAGGGLTYQSCLSEAGDDTCASTAGLGGAARVVVSADGTMAYVAGFTGNTLVTFDRSPSGALTKRECVGQSGNVDLCPVLRALNGPASLALSPDGGNLYVAAKSSNALTVFTVDRGAVAGNGPAAAAPASIDALGDSFTRGVYSGGACGTTVDCPANSWSTGTTPSVNSHYLRLLALNPAISGHAVNRAVSGKKVDYLDTEVQQAIADKPDYVTILIGLNDACGNGVTAATMTPVTTFGSTFASAMADLTSHLPNTKVFVASIPDPYRVWQVLHTDGRADNAWTNQQICQSLLANPTSLAPTDEARRQTVRQRVVDYDTQLQSVCAQYANCRYDWGALTGWKAAPYDFSTTEFFHPSVQGQADIARVTAQAGFNFSNGAAPPPPPPAPLVTTAAASSVTQTTATANGTVDPQGQATSYHFDYGTSTSYGSATPGQAAPASAGPVSAGLTGLTPSTTYHVRLVASSPGGTATGADQTFTTADPPAPSSSSYAQTVTADGPVSYWRLGEASGTVAADAMGRNPATYSGGVKKGVAGAIAGDSAVALDGSTGVVAAPDSGSLHTGDTFSLEAWIEPAKLGTADGIVVKKSAWMVSLDASNRIVLYVPNVGAVATSKAAVPATTAWHYVVATKTGATVRLYLDGQDVTGTVTNRTLPSSTGALDLGNGAARWKGGLDEVALYDKALSAQTVAAHFAAATAPVAEAPVAVTGDPTGVDSATATLNGTVDPRGTATSYVFAYGTTTSYGSSTPPQDAGAGTGAQPASSTIGGLTAGQTYHYRLRATSAAGTSAGADATFTTAPAPSPPGGSAPTVATGAASGRTTTGATLAAAVNPQGQDTTFVFEYGTTTAYGSSTAPQSAGSGTTDQAVSAPVSGLSPGTTYHYRVSATNGAGTTQGADATFTTVPTYAQTVVAGGPVSYWRLGDVSGSVAADALGRNNGAYVGGVTKNVTPGAVGGDPAVSLNGTTGLISVPDSASLHTGDTFSLEAWIKPSKLGVADGIAVKKGAWMVSLDAGNRIVLYVPNVGPVATSRTAVADLTAWHDVVVTKDGPAVRIYLDGEDVTGTVTNRTLRDSTGALDLGNGAARWTGGLDEVAVYDSALSASDVATHYARR